MNLIILKGNVYNITTKETKNGGMMTKFSVSTKRNFAKEGEQGNDYHNCTCFGKTAEFVSKYFKQGSAILVQGEQRNDNKDNKDGKKLTYSNVLVNSVEFAGGGNGGNNNQNQKPSDTPSGADGFMNIPSGLEDELPFA